jgi:hypothetical protein
MRYSQINKDMKMGKQKDEYSRGHPNRQVDKQERGGQRDRWTDRLKAKKVRRVGEQEDRQMN